LRRSGTGAVDLFLYSPLLLFDPLAVGAEAVMHQRRELEQYVAARVLIVEVLQQRCSLDALDDTVGVPQPGRRRVHGRAAFNFDAGQLREILKSECFRS
jgi:hypothetical protein